MPRRGYVRLIDDKARQQGRRGNKMAEDTTACMYAKRQQAVENDKKHLSLLTR